MEYRQILRRLIEIERAIGVLDAFSLRRLVMEAEEDILQWEKEALETFQRRLIQRTRTD